MTNRLHRQLPALPVFLVFCLHLFNSSGLFAQPSFFNFTPPAVTTFPVGPLCSNSVANANPTPTVTSTISANITVSAFDPVQSGFPATDLWTAPTLNLVVYWHAEDDQGHSATFSFTVNFVDQTPPTLQNLPPATASYGSVVQVPDPPNVTATDNCNLGPNPVAYNQTAPPDTCQAGVFTRTWMATDAAGNTTVFTQTITITADNQPPTISFPPQNGSAPCEQLPVAYPAWLAQQMSLFSAYDVSGIKSYTNNGPASFPPGCAVPLTVVFRATDHCNSFSTATAVFTTSDMQGPAIVQEPADTVGYCAVNGNHLTKLGEWIHQHAYLVAADACSGNSYLTYIMKKNTTTLDSAGVVAAFLASYTNGCSAQQVRGEITIEFLVQDACGNTTNAGQATYRAIDTLPPAITGVNITEQCGGGNDAVVLQAWVNAHGNATVNDECSATTWTNFSYTTSDGQSGTGAFGTGPYPAVQASNCNWWADVTFRATDECDNIGSKTLHFQIKDTLKPVIAGFPPTVTLYCPNPMPTLSPAFVTDNCDTSMAIAYTFTTSDTICSGAYTMHVTWSATDDCSNTGYATQTVLVRDTVGPVFTLVPGPKTIRCDTFALPPSPVLGVDIQAADNCSQASNLSVQDVALQDPDPAVCGHYAYDIIRTFTVSDACGNTRTATQVISVTDDLGPAPGGVLDTTIVCDAQPVVTTPPSPIDACSGPAAVPVFVNDVVMNGICDDNYTITRNWLAKDVCGNTSIIAQTIHIVDTVPPVWTSVPPDVTVECDGVPPVAAVTASDNCDDMVTITLQESEIRSPDTTDCSHWTNYIIRREWTAADNCGNTIVHTQNISVQDNTGPVIVPVPLVMLPAEPGLCSATLGIPAPVSVYDKCTALPTNVTLRDTSLLVNTSGGPNGTTPVDTIVIQWTSPNMPPDAPALDPVTLKISLDNADAEGGSEYFRVYGEDGFLIGSTNTINPPIQCGFVETFLNIPAAKLNDWLTDGQITLILAPNGNGSGAINALPSCMGGRVRSELAYVAGTPQLPITLLYSLDGDTAEVFPPATGVSLQVGAHTVTYTAIDCAGNSSTATTTIEVKDLQPPVITPPAPDTFFVDPGTCLAMVKLPFPAISDNCDVSGHLVQASASLPVIFENDPNAGLIPKDIVLSIPGLIPNAISSGVLEIRHKGDNDDAPGGEFFQVLDETDTPLTMTSSGMTWAQCSLFHETVLNVPAATINQWAAGDQVASFKLVANDDAGTFIDFINPCATLLPDKTDGISRVQAVLEYSFAVITYEIRNSSNQLLKFGSLEGNETMDTLPPGVYTVKYLTTDVNGLEGSTNFTFTVRDTIRPAAQCESQTIYVNPSGLPGDTYVLQPSEIDNNSTDNCPGNLTYQLSQTNFSCAQAGSNFTVTMTVTDASGNSSSCSAIVSVQTTVIQPSFDELCEGDTLKLYANPPGSASGYNWSGPAGFSSVLANPQLVPAQLQNEGTYCVTVTGLTGCTATGCVTVDFVNLAQPVISANKVTLCHGENVVLATPTYGTNATYQWYEDVLPSPMLIATTNLPVHTVNTPTVGIHRYFVKVLADDCASFNSNLLSITVNPIPPASVDPAVIDVCECTPVALNSSTPTLVGLTYMWMGPAGFNSTDPDPLVTNCATQIHKGIYTLVTKQNGCSSLPATVNVNVRTKPATPPLTGATQVCEGASVTLLTQYQAGIDKYIWQSPSLDTIITNINSLVLTNVMVADSGVWRVRTMQQGCYSDWSAPILVEVQAYPDVTGSANSPLCQGATLQLSATSNDAITGWTWSGPVGWVRFQQNPTRTPAVGGIYKVTGKTSFGCADSAMVTVQVIDPPVITSATNTAPLCADGSKATLQAVVVSENPPLNYIWTGPNGGIFPVPMPMIPNVTSANNGTYTLVVYDKFGCSSTPASTVIAVNDPPVTPLLTTPPTVCAGADITITVSNANQYNNPEFTWLTPTGITTSTQPFLVVDSALVQNAGNYYAIVKVGDCVSDTSAPANLVVNPVPAVPQVTANSPVCEGETLQLNTPFVPGATYAWIGPAGFNSAVRNPMRAGMISAWSGNYNVQITVNGCASLYGEGITVTVKPRPKLPVISPPVPAEVCLEQAGSVLTLQITPTSAEPGSRYTWFYQGTMDTIAGPSFSLSLQTSNFNGFVPGWNSFYVIAYGQNGCNSLPSNPVQVDFDTIPKNSAFAGMDQDACITSPLKLSATNPAPAATGQWTQVTTLPIGMIVTPNNFMTEVTGAQPGQVYRFGWTLSNGGCKNYGSDTVSITTFAPELPQVIDEVIDTCYATAIQLHAVQGATTPGYWSQEPGQAILGIYFHDPTDPNTIADSLTPGNTYYFFWNLDNGACGITSKRVTVINYGSVAKGGEDKILCSNDSCTTLIADPLPGGETGQWTSNDPDLEITSPNLNTTSVCNLKRGQNILYWTTNGGRCGLQSRDAVMIVYDLLPTAVPDTFEVGFGETININVVQNDILPQQPEITVVQEPVSESTFTDKGMGQFTYQPNPTAPGQDQMIYKVCNLVCPTPACSTATVIFLIGEPGDCDLVYNVITPNDDGVNDFLFVPCLDRGEILDNEVTIFNQWGDQVYHAQPYDNDKPWTGQYNGQDLPVGTYFYVIKFNGQNGVKKGFLQLTR